MNEDDLNAILKDSVDDISAILGDLPLADLQTLKTLEEADKTPRKTLLEQLDKHIETHSEATSDEANAPASTDDTPLASVEDDKPEPTKAESAKAESAKAESAALREGLSDLSGRADGNAKRVHQKLKHTGVISLSDLE